MRLHLLLVLLLLLPGAHAARISGTAYTQDLQVAQYAVLMIDTEPPQRLILAEGSYDVNVPTGNYTLRVLLKKQSRQYEDSVNISVQDEEEYAYDFILFPVASQGTTELDVGDITIPEVEGREGPSAGTLAIIGMLVLALLGLGAWLWQRRQTQSMTPASAPAPHAEALAPEVEDLESILSHLRREGGRTTQKELRKAAACSEAKLSMMLTELEAKGRIQKIKKGRGNLIILKR